MVRPALWRRLLAPGAHHVADPGRPLAAPLEDLHARGFFVADGVDEIAAIRLHYLAERHDHARRLNVNILTTLACNIRCPYCFQGKTQAAGPAGVMSRATEDAVVGYLKADLKGRRGLTVSWFGGEPLLTVRTIERLGPRLAEVCAEAELAYTAILTTNGILLTPDAASQLAAAGVEMVQVTVDIPLATKRDRKGRDTRDTVLDNLAAAVARLRVHLRINLTKDDEAEWEALFDGLVRRGLHRTLKSVNIANVYQPEHASGGNVKSGVPHRDYVAVLRRQRERARALGLPMHESLAWRKASGCAATAETAYSIDPDGLLYKCPEDAGRPERAYGSVFAARPANPANLVPWLAYDWFQHAQCRDCLALPQCAGGCPHRRLFQPDLHEDDFCYWFLRGDIEGRVRELALSVVSGAAGPAGVHEEGCGV